MAAYNPTFQEFQAQNNQGITLQQLANQHQVTKKRLLNAMKMVHFFEWNGERAHGKVGRVHHFKLNLPPYLGHVHRHYTDKETFQQVMNQIANDVGMPFGMWVASFGKSTYQGQHFINNAADWDEATEYFNNLKRGAVIRRFTLTIHLVMPGHVFQA